MRQDIAPPPCAYYGRSRQAVLTDALPPHSLAPFPPLFTMDDLEAAYQWITKLRKDYSPNSDIWNLRRDWEHVQGEMLAQLNDGSYRFDPVERHESDGRVISLWSSRDMIALKLAALALGEALKEHIPKSCYHVRGHGGLKKAITDTQDALPGYRYVMRSDIKSYYASIQFHGLMDILRAHVAHPVLLALVYKACCRTETWGGLFQDFDTHGLPKGSPLSPILAAAALLPLDQAMAKRKGVFYQRFMDDWLVLTRSKTALRKAIKATHAVLHELKLQIHPAKTYIGKISNGFNFLGFYLDHDKILPSKETLRRYHERSIAVFYEQPRKGGQSRHRRPPINRDTSHYQANEAAPTDEYFKGVIAHLLSLAAQKLDKFVVLRRYARKWSCWLKSGLSTLDGYVTSVKTHLPSIFFMWMSGALALDEANAGCQYLF